MSITLDGDNLTTVGVINSKTAQASTSGTAIDFTSIPAGTKRITVIFDGVSLSSTASYLIQLGTGATPTYATTGYLAYYSLQETGGTPAVTANTNGFRINANNAGNLRYGTARIVNITGNTWVCDGVFVGTNSAAVASYFTTGGSTALGAALTAVRITSTSTDTFDAGTINILYE